MVSCLGRALFEVHFVLLLLRIKFGHPSMFLKRLLLHRVPLTLGGCAGGLGISARLLGARSGALGLA